MSAKRAETPFDDATSFRGQVRMAAVQVAGLRPAELEVALAFEMEPVSGIPASEADLAFRSVPDPDPSVRVYDVAVRRRKAAKTADAARCLRPVLIAGVALLTLAAIDAVWLGGRKAALEKEVGKRSGLQAQVDAIRSRAKGIRGEAARLRDEREAVAKAQDEAAALRGAYLDVLGCLASACGEKAVLKSFAGEPFTLKAKVVAVSAQSAADMMADLAAQAEKSKWRLEVGPIAATGRGATAECEFTLKHD